MDESQIFEQSNNLFNELARLHKEYYEFWAHNVLLSWRWWLDLSLLAIPWIVWLIVKKKESTHRLLFAGMFVMIVSLLMDNIGVSYGLWSYPYDVIPLMPGFIRFDLSTLPVAAMLFLQFFPKVNPVYKAVVFSALAAFIFEPLMIWLGLYNEKGWHHVYSFVILILVYLGANFVFTRNKFEKIRQRDPEN